MDLFPLDYVLEDKHGNKRSGNELYVYLRGTIEEAPGYTAEDPDSPAVTYPLVADVEGRFPNAWYPAGRYDIHDPSDSVHPIQPWTPGAGDNSRVAVIEEAPLNVQYEEFGASGRLAKDDTTSIQAAIDKIANSSLLDALTVGGSIYIPGGSYLVNGQLDIPPGIAIRIFGDGCGWGFTSGTEKRGHVTLLRRSTAYDADVTKAMISAIGNGDRINLALEGMLLDGKGGLGVDPGAPLLDLQETNFLHLQSVIVKDHEPSAGNPSVRLLGTYNGTVENCKFHSLGGDQDPEASSPRGQGAGVAVCDRSNTVHFTDCEWEGCNGTDLFLGGGTPAVSLIIVSNYKIERGQTNDPGAWPHILVGEAQSSQFLGGAMPCFREVPAIKVHTPASSPIMFDGLTLTGTTDYDRPAYYVEIEEGSASFESTHCSSPSGTGGPSVAYVLLGADAGDFTFRGITDPDVPLVDDQRT